jgi:DNA-directed RNA polymerase specialized sigma24 family protein
MVELRYFGGLKMEEIGEIEKTSAETVRKELRLAEAWLLSYLRRDCNSAQ